jgi:hypothetical protein
VRFHNLAREAMEVASGKQIQRVGERYIARLQQIVSSFTSENVNAGLETLVFAAAFLVAREEGRLVLDLSSFVKNSKLRRPQVNKAISRIVFEDHGRVGRIRPLEFPTLVSHTVVTLNIDETGDSSDIIDYALRLLLLLEERGIYQPSTAVPTATALVVFLANSVIRNFALSIKKAVQLMGLTGRDSTVYGKHTLIKQLIQHLSVTLQLRKVDLPFIMKRLDSAWSSLKQRERELYGPEEGLVVERLESIRCPMNQRIKLELLND